MTGCVRLEGVGVEAVKRQLQGAECIKDPTCTCCNA